MVETVEVATAVAAAIEVDERATMSIEIAHANHPPSPKSDCSLTARHRIITYLHHLFISSLKSTCPVCCSSFFIKKALLSFQKSPNPSLEHENMIFNHSSLTRPHLHLVRQDSGGINDREPP